MASRPIKKNLRKWARLQLAIPVFIRTHDENNKDLLEFATAINISAGGALVATRHSLPKSTAISLEIPSAPIGPLSDLPNFPRPIRAKAVWVSHLDDYHLMGLKFSRPLNTDAATGPQKQMRKAITEV
ncbi:MAG: PilZ domain-containing protein [Terriglobales bacterium]